MENRITGRSPDPLTDDEVDLTDNLPAQELCEEVKQVTAQAREGLLMQALSVSNEKCNDLILTQNVRIAELTRQVKNVEWQNELLERNLNDDLKKFTKDVKESNEKLSRDLNQTLDRITTTVSGIERQVNTPQRIANRKYEERNKEKRQAASGNFQTMIPRELYDEINAFLKKRKMTKVDFIKKAYDYLKSTDNSGI